MTLHAVPEPEIVFNRPSNVLEDTEGTIHLWHPDPDLIDLTWCGTYWGDEDDWKILDPTPANCPRCRVAYDLTFEILEQAKGGEPGWMRRIAGAAELAAAYALESDQ